MQESKFIKPNDKKEEDKVETDFLPHWEAVSWSYPSKGLFFMFQTIKQFSKC